MNRIDETLANLKAKGKKVLSPYITAGDPEPEMTVSLMHELVAAGADILELGIPFSDPMAEGPVIQMAMERALAQKVTYETVLAMIRTFREADQQTPIILMGYTNPVEQCGYDNFAKLAKQAGADGTILVDLPPEESEEMASIWQEQDLYSIYLCSPTTTAERMAMINDYGKGYLYYVSLKGVTGSNDIDLAAVKTVYQARKSQTTLPLMVGFGIKTADMAAKVAQFADGVIVGAALVGTIFAAYEKSGKEAAIAAGAALIRELRTAIDKNEMEKSI